MLGVIGRNGAGKSTLLKILTRITTPTRGRAEIRGRVGSLLEVGTGFHPELTGRENIYLNGAILGMKRREIDAKFDEIVEFSGVEKFIDTPVKRYSSGMYVRLAFAVAAHLEPEILLVDEVLAVGDAEFQRRCLGRMEDSRQVGPDGGLRLAQHAGGRAALRSRDSGSTGGRIVRDGPSRDVVAHYLQSGLGLGRGHDVARSDEAPGRRSRPAALACASSTRTATTRRRRRRPRAGRDRDRVSPCSREAGRRLPEDQGRTTAGDVAFNAMDTTRAGTSPRRRASTCATAWIPGEPPERGRRSPSTSAVARSARRSSTTTRRCTRPSSFHVQDSGRGRLGEGPRSPGSGTASCARCSTGRPSTSRRGPTRRRSRRPRRSSRASYE